MKNDPELLTRPGITVNLRKGMRKLILLLACLCIPAEDAMALSTKLYFRIAAGVRSLSTTVPQDSENGTCAGVGSALNQGCDVLRAGSVTNACNGERQDLSTPRYEYRFIVPEDWGLDGGASETKFKYYGAYFANGSFAQPKFQVTYQYNEAAPASIELMGTSCPCGVGGPGCNLTSPYVSPQVPTPTEFDRDVGGNISGSGLPSPSLLGQLKAGSTILVEFWTADGGGDGILYSTTTYSSYIVVPYSKDNFQIYGTIAPSHILTSPAPAVSMTYTLDNVKGVASIDKVEIFIPGNIQGSGAFFGSVSSVVVPSKTGEVVTVTQASSSGDGTISIDFSADLVGKEVITINFSAVAPTAALQSIKWDGRAWDGPASFTPSEKSVDSLFTAVLDLPSVPTGLTVNPQNTKTGGGTLQVSWTGPTPEHPQAVTTYRIFRDGSEITTVIPFPMGTSSWKPATNIGTSAGGQQYSDGGRTNGQLYCYEVKAVNPVGESVLTAQVCASPYADPGAPGVLAALVRDQVVELAWSPAAGGTFALTGYEIFRTTCAACPGPNLYMTLWDTLPPTYSGTSFMDESLTNGAMYSYQVRGFDVEGHRGNFSPLATAQPAVNPPTGLTSSYDHTLSRITLQWQSSSNNVFALGGYNIYRSHL